MYHLIAKKESAKANLQIRFMRGYDFANDGLSLNRFTIARGMEESSKIPKKNGM